MWDRGRFSIVSRTRQCTMDGEEMIRGSRRWTCHYVNGSSWGHDNKIWWKLRDGRMVVN